MRCDARRDDDFDQWIVLRDGLIGRLAVMGTIGSALANFVFDLIKQWTHLGRIINVPFCQYRGYDQPSIGLYRQVQLSPATA